MIYYTLLYFDFLILLYGFYTLSYRKAHRMIWGRKGTASVSGRPHVHDMHELFICLGRNGRQLINGESINFSPGRACMLPGGSSHHIETTGNKKAEFAFICFDPSFFMKRGEHELHRMLEKIVKENCYFSGQDEDYLRKNIVLINGVIDEFENVKPYAREKTALILGELLIEYFRSLNFSSTSNKDENRNIEKICREITENSERVFLLQNAAKKAGMSRTAFARSFKAYSGMTFVDFIHSVRVKKAMELFWDKKLSVAETAFTAGFNNLGHFHKVFKKYCRMTPFAFKKKIAGIEYFPKFIKEKKSIKQQ